MNNKKNKMAEKQTDFLMQELFKNTFGFNYKTKNKKKYFNSKQPDGYYITDTIAIIIENKYDINDFKQARKQMKEYITILKENTKYTNDNIYCIFGFGDKENFQYKICKLTEQNIFKLQHIQLKDILLDNLDKKYKNNIYHKINQYLENNSIILPKQHKTLLISLILLILHNDKDFIKNNNLENKDGNIIALKMIEYIQQIYKDSYFTSAFEFIKNSIHTKYLLNIINLIHNNIDKFDYNIDIINKFYCEICQHDKDNNDNENGIVLTPPDIIKIMVDNLDIQDEDIICDITCGTSSFLKECYNRNQNVILIGCENNIERYALSKCNFLLLNINSKKLYHSSCFDIDFGLCDKIILNPPFCGGECAKDKDYKEILPWKNLPTGQKFTLYALQYLKLNGIACIIIPTANFTDTTNYNKIFKETLINNNFQILKTILCNSLTFQPMSDVGCSIIVLKKVEKYDENYETEIIDYTDDGYKICNKMRIKQNEPNIKSYKQKLNTKNNWIYFKTLHNDLNINIDKLVEIYDLNEEFNNKLNLIEEKYNNQPIKEYNYNKYKFIDIVEKIPKYKSFNENKTKSGIYPLYGATKNNRPKKFINEFSINATEPILCIGKTGNGGAGICFVRTGKFAVLKTVLLFKLKINLSKKNIILLSEQLHSNFNHSSAINNEKINNLEIYLIDE